jgi:hypothetical protein
MLNNFLDFFSKKLKNFQRNVIRMKKKNSQFILFLYYAPVFQIIKVKKIGMLMNL